MEEQIQILITQGYSPEAARKMVESGNYDKMVGTKSPQQGVTPYGGMFPGLDFTQMTEVPLDERMPNEDLGNGSLGTDYGYQGINANGGQGQTENGSQNNNNRRGMERSIQYFLDKGYTLEEATQLAESETFGNEMNEGKATLGDISDFFINSGIGSGVSLEQAAYGLGNSIGEKDGLSIAANSGKLLLGGARAFTSGLGQAKRAGYVEEYRDKKNQEGLGRNNFIASPQYRNTNYSGGTSLGEQGGIQGKTLPLKEFLKNSGFTNPRYIKL